MATSKSKKSQPRKDDGAQDQDALALLTSDHDVVKALFDEFEDLSGQEEVDERKAELVQQICNELTVHAQVEEEVYYPAVREAIDDDALMDEADVEHASAKDLVAQLEGMSPGDDHYDAKVVVLGEYVKHHIDEEEGEMFDQVRESEIDTAALGAELAARKGELKAELGLEDDAADGVDEMSELTAKHQAVNGGKKPRPGAPK
jgi:hemerythrin-like domain-containing protein